MGKMDQFFLKGPLGAPGPENFIKLQTNDFMKFKSNIFGSFIFWLVLSMQ